jgi:hypothetical protein
MRVSSGMDSPAPEVGTMHTTPMEAAAAPKASTATTAS